MGVVVAVLAKLRKEKNPFICKEEIEDLYCMRMVVHNDLKCRHQERTRSAITKAEDAHDDIGVERKTGQDEVTGGARRAPSRLHSKRDCARQEESIRRENKCHSGELVTSAATVPGAARVPPELEKEQGQTNGEHKEYCRAAARAELLQAIQSPPVLKTIPKPKRKTNHLVSIEIHIRKKYRGKSKGAGI